MGDVNHEPTMEEILASIKKIIAEDGEDRRHAPSAPRRAPEAKVAEETPDVLELTETIEPEEQPVETSTAEPDLAPNEIETAIDTDIGEPEDPIVSDVAAAASRQALASLSAMKSARGEADAGGEALERVVRDMLRPMLKQWLDANLPAIVERIVAREVARITHEQD